MWGERIKNCVWTVFVCVCVWVKQKIDKVWE